MYLLWRYGLNCENCETRGVEKLLTSLFGSTAVVNLKSVERHVDQSRRLFIRDVA